MTNHISRDVVTFENWDIARYKAGERRMPMRGFEPEYTDIVDYIIRITHRIWEEKEVGYIYDTYQHNCIIHDGNGDRHGREGVVAATLQTQAALTDCTLYGDQVIWTGNQDDGFQTSHLVTGITYNRGYGAYGPPTGRKIVARAIADCVIKDNLIFEEWVLHDDSASIRQMGYKLHEVAERQVRAALDSNVYRVPSADTERVVGQHAPQPLPTRVSNNGFDVEDFIRTTYHEIWNRRRLNLVAKRYHPSHICITTGERRFHGTGELTSFILNMLAMFPDMSVSVDQVYWNGNDSKGYNVAVRWTLTGTHLGYGEYGVPSGARIRAMCLSQHQIKDGMLVQESSLFDELSIARQIAAQRLRADVRQISSTDDTD